MGKQKNATDLSHSQLFYMGAALHMRWHIQKIWSVGLGPEVYSDPDRLMTSFDQFIWAITVSGNIDSHIRGQTPSLGWNTGTTTLLVPAAGLSREGEIACPHRRTSLSFRLFGHSTPLHRQHQASLKEKWENYGESSFQNEVA